MSDGDKLTHIDADGNARRPHHVGVADGLTETGRGDQSVVQIHDLTMVQGPGWVVHCAVVEAVATALGNQPPPVGEKCSQFVDLGGRAGPYR